MNKKFIFLILIQVIVIIYLTISIYKKKHNVLGVVDINPIEKKSFDFVPTDNLRFFHEPKPNSVEEVNEWVPYKGTYTINSDSLNERFDYPIEKSFKTYRIITLGDSFTYGLYVDTKDNWPERLEDMLNERLFCQNPNRYEVINLGVHGYDIQYSVERFRSRGQKYNPDLVLWLIVDPLRIDEKIFEYLPEYEKELKSRGELDALIKSGVYYQPWVLATNRIIKELGFDGIQDYQKIALKKINDYYKKNLVLVLGPWLNEEERKIYVDFAQERDNTWIFDKMTNTNNVPELIFLNDHHPNQKGHLTIAQDIFKYLVYNKFIPCR